jgi:UDP-2,3-diacylglucosamine pyrophosphatase LpxH
MQSFHFDRWKTPHIHIKFISSWRNILLLNHFIYLHLRSMLYASTYTMRRMRVMRMNLLHTNSQMIMGKVVIQQTRRYQVRKNDGVGMIPGHVVGYYKKSQNSLIGYVNVSNVVVLLEVWVMMMHQLYRINIMV